MFQLDFRSREPIYEQIKQQVTQFAMTGVWKPHDQLPPVRQVALELNVNPNTIQKAYQQLDQAGVIYSVPGRGSFIAPLTKTNAYVREQVVSSLSKAVSQAVANGWTAEEVVGIVHELLEGKEEKK